MTAPAAPDISVVMATYNSQAYLPETLRSIREQSIKNFELIVADDGSSDGNTVALLRDAAQLDSRIRFIPRDHCGVRAVLGNICFRAAVGEIIVWLDDDDPMLPTRLEETLRAFRLAPPNAGLLFSDYHVIDSESRLLRPSGLEKYPQLARAEREQLAEGVSLLRQRTAFDTLMIGNYLRPSIVAMRRSCLLDSGLLDESLENGDDLDIFLRIARRFDFVWVERPLGRYRIRPGNISSRDPRRTAPSRIRVLEKQIREGLDRSHRRMARRTIAINLFDIGYAERTAGRYGSAVRVLVRSLGYAFSWMAVKELGLSIVLKIFA